MPAIRSTSRRVQDRSNTGAGFAAGGYTTPATPHNGTLLHRQLLSGNPQMFAFATRPFRPPPLRLADLEAVRTLGSGAFGEVLLARHTRNINHNFEINDALFALKAVRKKTIRNEELAEVKYDVTTWKHNERRTLTQLPWHPFISGLFDVFHDDRNIYCLMEYGSRESLHDFAVRMNHCILETQLRFYFANIILGIEFLHQHDIMHRDIKLGNILLNRDGYLMLADFGCAAHKSSGQLEAWTEIGTPPYNAPEMLEGSVPYEQREYGDWWALAVAMFELAANLVPWRSDMPQLLTDIKSIPVKTLWPDTMDVIEDPEDETGGIPQLKNLLERMLHPIPEKRLGRKISELNGFKGRKNYDLRRHPWLRNKVLWNAIASRRVPAPKYSRTRYDPLTMWQNLPLPLSKDLPGTTINDGPYHIQHDSRLSRRHHRSKRANKADVPNTDAQPA